MIRVNVIGSVVLASLALAQAAFAQRVVAPPRPAPPTPPVVQSLSIGAVGGLQAVKRAGGFRRRPSRRSRVADAGDLRRSRGCRTPSRGAGSKPRRSSPTICSRHRCAATATITAPAWWFGGGVQHVVATHGTLQLLAMGQAGVARVAIRPAFTLGGGDVTTRLPDYGVALGSDLTGAAMVPAFGGGVALRIPHGIWNVDAGIRILSLRTSGQPSNVLRCTDRLQSRLLTSRVDAKVKT